jgi:transcription elongation regulator 1
MVICNAAGHDGQVNEQLEDKKTETGAVYYYNALTGESTYQRRPGYKGEVIVQRNNFIK